MRILGHMYFGFDDQCDHQIGGTANGVGMAFVYANTFMCRIFLQFLAEHPHWASVIPFLRRMLDDSFGFFGDETSTKAMVSSLNSWSIRKGYKVQFVFTGFGKEVNFLDLGIYLNRRSEWHSRVYSKDTDVHAYLHPPSAHPKHIIRSVPRMVALRLRSLF